MLESYASGRLAEFAAPAKAQRHSSLGWGESMRQAVDLSHPVPFDRIGIHRQDIAQHHTPRNVVLVGAGITNLMTAELLARRGYQVRIVDAGPNPKLCNDSTRLGATNGGGNARMFTKTEADNYNETGSEIYQDMQSVFRRTVLKGGWSVKPPKDFTAAELAWVNAFEKIPAHLARTFKKDIHRVNMEAGKLWKEYIETFPDLFQGVEFCKDVLRIYVEPTALQASMKLNCQLGALIHAPSLQDILDANPGFHPAAEAGHLSGGIMVDGFTVNIHPFVDKLMDRITEFGGEFLWNFQVQRIQRNSTGQVMMLESPLGQLEADHFVVSPGATGNGLLRGTACEDLIHGVLGVWLQIPNLDPKLRHSVKIHRRGHLVEDINITVAKDERTGQDMLIFGGGYGYVGLDHPAPDSRELSVLFDELELVARIYFPRGHAAAHKTGSMHGHGSRKFCVRPFTPTGLGVFESMPTANGGHLIITGGNNTGGFAQAPAIARAVWRTLVAEHDPIHDLFHPDRGRFTKAHHGLV